MDMNSEMENVVEEQNRLQHIQVVGNWSSTSNSSGLTILSYAAVLSVGVGLSSSASEDVLRKRALISQSSTTSTFAPDPLPLIRKSIQKALPSTSEQLKSIQSVFCLNKTDLAKVCQVQRQTVYDWTGGKYPATGDNERRLSALFQIASTLKAEGTSLGARVAARRLESGESVLSLLTESPLNVNAIVSATAALAAPTQVRPADGARALMQRHGLSTPSDARQAQTLEDNLSGLVDG